MVFTTAKTGGGTITLGHLDKIDVNGELLVITGIGARADGARTKRKPPTAIPRMYYPFIGLDPDTLAPQWGPGVTIEAQIKPLGTGETGYSQQLSAKEGADQPITCKLAYCLEAANQTWPHVRLMLWDITHGLMVPDLYTVKYLPPPTITTPGDPELGIPAEVEPGAPLLLDPTQVNLNEQIVPVGNQMIRRGDACITVPRNGLTEDMLMNPEARFEITLPGGAVVLYQVPGNEGFETLLTYHYKIYLNRLRP